MKNGLYILFQRKNKKSLTMEELSEILLQIKNKEYGNRPYIKLIRNYFGKLTLVIEEHAEEQENRNIIVYYLIVGIIHAARWCDGSVERYMQNTEATIYKYLKIAIRETKMPQIHDDMLDFLEEIFRFPIRSLIYETQEQQNRTIETYCTLETWQKMQEFLSKREQEVLYACVMMQTPLPRKLCATYYECTTDSIAKSLNRALAKIENHQFASSLNKAFWDRIPSTRKVAPKSKMSLSLIDTEETKKKIGAEVYQMIIDNLAEEEAFLVLSLLPSEKSFKESVEDLAAHLNLSTSRTIVKAKKAREKLETIPELSSFLVQVKTYIAKSKNIRSRQLRRKTALYEESVQILKQYYGEQLTSLLEETFGEINLVLFVYLFRIGDKIYSLDEIGAMLNMEKSDMVRREKQLINTLRKWNIPEWNALLAKRTELPKEGNGLSSNEAFRCLFGDRLSAAEEYIVMKRLNLDGEGFHSYFEISAFLGVTERTIYEQEGLLLEKIKDITPLRDLTMLFRSNKVPKSKEYEEEATKCLCNIAMVWTPYLAEYIRKICSNQAITILGKKYGLYDGELYDASRIYKSYRVNGYNVNRVKDNVIHYLSLLPEAQDFISYVSRALENDPDTIETRIKIQNGIPTETKRLTKKDERCA